MMWGLTRRPRHLLAIALACVLEGCGGYASTTRVVDGETIVGHPIEPEGYALYLNAQLSELRGALHRARQLYLEATRLDPDSPELWTRVGALSCRLKLALADRELERALDLDRWYAPAWVARARCELFRRNLDLALKFAKAGQVADPEDVETTLALVEVYTARRQPQKAMTQLRAFVLNHPDSIEAENHLNRWAAETAAPATSTPSSVTIDPTLSAIILREDLGAARTRATELQLPQALVARIALELNHPTLANQQMTLLIGAAPHDSELRALALLAAQRAHDTRTFERLLSLPPTFTRCSAACVGDLDQVLAGYRQ